MIDPSHFLTSLPPGLRSPLIECYREIVRNYTERRWEPAELNGGKFCEIVYTILDGAINGNYATAPSKPSNMVLACRALETQPGNPTRIGDRSLRILIPRLIPFLYEIRNNRNVGHVGGEVNPNHADTEAVLGMANWVMAELVRIFHNVSLAQAQAVVESFVEKRHPLIWKVGGTKRVLNTKLSKKDQTLALLYSESDWIEVQRLCEWVEYSSLSGFKSNVLIPQHKERLLEFDSNRSRVKITPRGIEKVEKTLLDAP